jgi:predicted metal-binding protein
MTQSSASVPTPASAAPEIYVCTTCRNADAPETRPYAGEILAEATEAAAAGSEVVVRRLRCLANCSQGPSVALRCNGSWTYIFGRLAPDHAQALIDGARLLATARDGILPWRGRPEVLKRGLIARVPPLAYQEIKP